MTVAKEQDPGHPLITVSPVYSLAFALAFAPTLAIFLPRGLALLFALPVLAALPVLRQWRQLRWPPRSFLWVLAAFHAWQMISILWCLDPSQALRSTTGMIGLSLGGCILMATASALPDKDLGLVLRAATVGLLLGGVVFTVEAIWGIAIREAVYPLVTGKPFTLFLPLQRMNRASTVIAVLAAAGGLWPAGGASLGPVGSDRGGGHKHGGVFSQLHRQDLPDPWAECGGVRLVGIAAPGPWLEGRAGGSGPGDSVCHRRPA